MVVKEAVARAGRRARAGGRGHPRATSSRPASARRPARQAAIRAGLPPTVAALTINKVCGSGLKAVMLAAQGDRRGRHRRGGGGRHGVDVELPLPAARGARGDAPRPRRDDGLDDPRRPVGRLRRLPHGLHAARSWPRSTASRAQEQDACALESHRKAVAAIKAGRFEDEILPVPIPQKKGDRVLVRGGREPARGHVAGGAGPPQARVQGGRHRDRGQRAGRERRRGGARGDVGGDGARPWAARPWRASWPRPWPGLDPAMVMMTPVPAVRKLLKKTGWSADSVDLVELNEAFAVQAVAVVPRAGPRPRPGQRERRRGGARPSDRRQRRPCRRHRLVLEVPGGAPAWPSWALPLPWARRSGCASGRSTARRGRSPRAVPGRLRSVSSRVPSPATPDPTPLPSPAATEPPSPSPRTCPTRKPRHGRDERHVRRHLQPRRRPLLAGSRDRGPRPHREAVGRCGGGRPRRRPVSPRQPAGAGGGSRRSAHPPRLLAGHAAGVRGSGQDAAAGCRPGVGRSGPFPEQGASPSPRPSTAPRRTHTSPGACTSWPRAISRRPS